jgi:ATP-dependent Clp protease ATP-binding subunit ClpA
MTEPNELVAQYLQARTERDKAQAALDEASARLTAKVFDRYTVKKLDRKRMEEAMDTGAIDPVTVSRYVELKPSRPYLEYREKEITE